MSMMSVAMRRAGSGEIDRTVACIAALAAGAAVFVMPGAILEQAVRASGLPDFLPQLSPPLGMKARAGLALLSAGSAFGTALLMLRLLAFVTRPRDASPVVDEHAPRTRRRDRHPDAPVRAPLSISRDLGEPAIAPQPEPEPWGAPKPEPVPFESAQPRMKRPATRRRAPLIEVLGDIHEEPQPEPAEEPRRIKPGREAEEPWEPAAAKVAAAAPEPEPMAEPEPAPAPAPEESVVEEIVVPSAPKPTLAPEPDPVPPQPAWLATPASASERPAQESLTELLARLERALERQAANRTAPAPAAAAEAEETAPEDGMDMRLRSALENLRRFAPGRG